MSESDLNLVDEAYEAKMAAFEVDCNDGQGEPMACHHVGEFYSVVKDEHHRSAKIYTKNCDEKNYGASCFNLGRLFIAGKGVPQSDTKAEEYFGKACAQKHLQACYHQGVLIYTSCDDPATKAVNSTTSSSSTVPPKELPGGVINAQLRDKKRGEALKLFDWACKEGEIDSCYVAGGHYLDRNNTDRNPAEAAKYMERSCAANHAPSCYNLAVLFRKGDTGVPADNARFEEFKERTNALLKQYGGLGGTRTN